MCTSRGGRQGGPESPRVGHAQNSPPGLRASKSSDSDEHRRHRHPVTRRSRISRCRGDWAGARISSFGSTMPDGPKSTHVRLNPSAVQPIPVDFWATPPPFGLRAELSAPPSWWPPIELAPKMHPGGLAAPRLIGWSAHLEYVGRLPGLQRFTTPMDTADHNSFRSTTPVGAADQQLHRDLETRSSSLPH